MKLLILGLDGATFDVIDKFDSNELPFIKMLIAQGTRGTLESTYPPVTGPAWPALATGKNPGKTGVFDFRSRTTKDNFDLKMVTSANFRLTGTWWDYLNEVGIKVGIWNYPVLYPPYPTNGFMVSGFGSSPDSQFTYPEVLRGELFHACDGYGIQIPFSTSPYVDNPSLFVEDTIKLLDKNEKAIHHLLTKDIDVFVGVISVTDFIQHYMWKFLDDKHPLYDPKMAEMYKPAFVEIWKRVDKIIENVYSKAGDCTNTVIVSDHGFGPHYKSFYINTWLESKGYLVRKNSKTTLTHVFLQSTASKIINQLGNVSPRLSEILKKKGHKYARPFLSQIDMQKTIAFANEHSTNSGQIYINASKRREQSKKQIREQIAQELKEDCAKLGLKTSVYFPEQLYCGKFVNLAPDLLFDINDFECSVHYRFSRSLYKNVPHNLGHSGSHKMNGILIAHGPDIEQGKEIQGAKIYDIAPTILHMFGQLIPDDMDGRVLTEMFRGDSELAQRAIKYKHIGGGREKIRGSVSRVKKGGAI